MASQSQIRGCLMNVFVLPNDTWIFEDSPLGLKGAFATGANVIPVINSDDLKNKLRKF